MGHAEFRISESVSIKDGDGIIVGALELRLHGIDAPESGQKCDTSDGRMWDCAEKAVARLVELFAEGTLDCEFLGRDRYGRIISRCWVGDVDLSEALVRDGLAWAYTEYSRDYEPLEREARAALRGIWRAETQAPWDYRADKWARAVAEAPGGCPIKGNINTRGEKIYHTPWSPNYETVKIEEEVGEHWFCDEGTATEAGWRPRKMR